MKDKFTIVLFSDQIQLFEAKPNHRVAIHFKRSLMALQDANKIQLMAGAIINARSITKAFREVSSDFCSIF
jgi:hypothetical protein